MNSDVRARGEWPGAVQLRRAWASARARPWNDQTTTVAALRLDRGGDRFVVACCDWLAARGVDRVLTPALARGQLDLWRRAGFADHLELVVFERSLATPAPPPSMSVQERRRLDLTTLVAIDDRAFDETWRVGRGGLSDALSATPTSTILTVEEGGIVVGFLIVGASLGISYLQRLAVHPEAGRRGIGRSLVRAAIAWARARGARTMLLNTQPDNRVAASLYVSEGFEPLPTGLQVLAKKGEAAPTS